MDAFVLAGGASRRMGFDKARASVGGWPMAIRVALALRAVAERVVLVRRGPADPHPWRWLDQTPVEVVREVDEGARHPLWGVATALTAARSSRVLVAPCDVPGLPVTALRALVAAAPAVLHDDHRVHPLVAVLEATEAERAAAHARAGRSVRDFVAGLPQVRMHGVLANVNRSGDGVDRRSDLVARFRPLRGRLLEHALEAEAVRRLATRGAWVPWATDAADGADPMEQS